MMRYTGIIITGTSASGKSTIAKELMNRYVNFSKVIAVTTRNKRDDDIEGDYKYIKKPAFDDLLTIGNLLIHTEYRGESYGIEISELEKVIQNNRIPLLILTPDSANTLASCKMNEAQDIFSFPSYFSIFIDAQDALLDVRLKERNSVVNENVLLQRNNDRVFQDNFLYRLENNNLDVTINLIIWLWETSFCGGVLSHRIIKWMIECGLLLRNGDLKNISGASYDLSLGDEYFYAGKFHHLSNREPYLLIEPYDYAIVTSHEIANLPRDISGRFDLSVSLFFQGIILTNGPQVDPGFVGPLFCLLFNTSSSPVLLKRKQHYATIVFSKLLEPTYLYKGIYKGKELIHYLPNNAVRGAINDLRKELTEVREQHQSLQNTVWAILALILAVFAIWITLTR